MTRYAVLLAFITVVIFVSACNDSEPVSRDVGVLYRYLGEETGKVVTFDLAANEVDNGHRRFAIKPCEKQSFRLCLYGEFTIAVPKKGIKAGDEWQVSGTKFIVESVNVNTESAVADYTIVAQSSIDESIKIYFNDKSGVWGLRFLPNGEMYRSENSCGLGCKR